MIKLVKVELSFLEDWENHITLDLMDDADKLEHSLDHGFMDEPEDCLLCQLRKIINDNRDNDDLKKYHKEGYND